MKFGIFSDVHSNLEALEAVLADMSEHDVSKPVCLGDLVGYNANPKECIEKVRALKCPVVKGNFDERLVSPSDFTLYNSMASMDHSFTYSQVKSEQMEYLRTLPLVQKVDSFTIVHSSLDSPSRFDYLYSPSDTEAHFRLQETQLCFFGHTHIARAFVKDENLSSFSYSILELEPNRKYFINVGSVGQPQDRDWRAAYAIFDSDEQTVELRRVTYDIVAAQKKIKAAGLSTRQMERLEAGI